MKSASCKLIKDWIHNFHSLQVSNPRRSPPRIQAHNIYENVTVQLKYLKYSQIISYVKYWDQPDTLTWLSCAQKWLLTWLLKLELLKPEMELKSTNNYRKARRLNSRTFDLSNAFKVVTVWHTIPPYFTTFRCQKAAVVKYFDTFKIIFIDSINQRHHCKCQKLLGILFYWSTIDTSMKLQRGTLSNSCNSNLLMQKWKS